MTSSRILRILAIAAGLSLPVSLVGAVAAHAADQFVVDNDGITLRNTNSGNPVFTGTLQSWHDGSNTRGELTGSFTGHGDLAVAFTFHDGSTTILSTYTAGVAQSVDMLSPAGKTVVRATVNYTPTADSNCYAGSWYNPSTGTCDPSAPPSARKQLVYVGDSPQSLGTCQQLDDDDLSMQASNSAAFFGHVDYGCTSTGQITAHVTGSLNWMSSTTGTVGGAVVTFTYADGTSQTVFVHQVYRTGTTTSNADITSTATKNVRFVQMAVTRDNVQVAGTTQRFGDA